MNDMKIVTERLVLAPHGPRYLETTNEYAMDPENTKYMFYLPNQSSEETLTFLWSAEEEWAKDTPAYYEFAILYDGMHIGAVSIYFENDAGELGWIINKKYWGQGFGYEAARALVDHFAGQGVRRFIAHCDTENVPSRKIMEKLGMTLTGEYGGRRNRGADHDSFEYQYELEVTSTPGEDSQKLIDFWDKAFAMSDEDQAEARPEPPEDWRQLAPSEKLCRAAESLGCHEKVLDYGCGNAWAAVIAAKSGCADVTAVDPAAGAAQAARFCAEICGVEKQVHVSCIRPDWLKTVPSDTYSGAICSNVLDVVPPEIAEEILRELSRVMKADGRLIIGMNYYLSPEAAAEKGMELLNGRMLYMDGVLRLVSRTDEEWTEILSSYCRIERLEHFAWPGETTERRRLFYLRK